GGLFRAHYVCLVLDAGDPRAQPDPAQPHGASCLEYVLWFGVVDPSPQRVLAAGRGIPLYYRRRGALFRPWALRPEEYPGQLDLRQDDPGAQLSWARRLGVVAAQGRPG